MEKISSILAIILLLIGYTDSSCLRIIIIPGLLELQSQTKSFADMINMKRPCARAEVFALNGGFSSSIPIWKQVEQMRPKFLEYIRDNPDGLILVGGSQGAMICRGLIQTTSEHNVKQFYSFAGPQQGSFSLPVVSFYLPIVKTLTSISEVSKLLYTPLTQNTASIANLWKDPQQYDIYLEKNIFLPFCNNEKPHNRSQMFKDNLLKLDRFVLMGGDKDQALDPWQTSLFGYYAIGIQNPNIVNMTDQEIYKNDTLGLKTMYEDGRLVLCHVPGADHQTIRSDQWGLNNCFFNYLI